MFARKGTWRLAGIVFVAALGWNVLSATVINSCGTTITQPGYYILVNDLEYPFSAINIRANNVVLELAGHNITGIGGPNAGIRVDGSDNVRIIGPSTIIGFTNGVVLATTRNCSVSMVTSWGNTQGFLVYSQAQSNVLEDNMAVYNADNGFDMRSGERNTFRRNKAIQNNKSGFELRAGTHENLVQGNNAEDNAYGVHTEYGATGNMIIGNSAHDNGEDLDEGNYEMP